MEMKTCSLFTHFSRLEIFSQTGYLPNCELLEKMHYSKVVWLDEYTKCQVNKLFSILGLFSSYEKPKNPQKVALNSGFFPILALPLQTP